MMAKIDLNREIKVLLLASYLNVFGFGFFGPIYALFVKEIGGTVLDVSLSWALYGLIMGVMIIFFGRLEDRLPDKRKMIVIGYFILAIGALSYVFVEDTIHLFIVQMLNGLGVAVLNPAFKAVFSKDEEKGSESHDWSLFEGGEKIMLASSALLGGIIVTYLSFRWMFIIMFVFQLFGALISIDLLHKRSNGRGNNIR